MAPRPPSGPSRPRLAVGRDRLVGHPALDVLGQGPAGAIPVLGPQGHGLEADRLQRPVDRGSRARGGGKSPRWTRGDHLDRIARERRFSGQEVIEGGPQAVDVAARTQVFQVALRPARGSCRPACPAPSRAGSRHCRWPRRARASARPRRGSARPVALARPQSTTRVSPCLPTMTFPGLMSRCSTPRLWA